jgi:hypothetical protein
MVKKQQLHTNRRETGADITRQKKIAIKPTHRKIETKNIAQPASLN